MTEAKPLTVGEVKKIGEQKRLVEGDISRMCATKDETELKSAYNWAKERLKIIYNMNHKRFEGGGEWMK